MFFLLLLRNTRGSSTCNLAIRRNSNVVVLINRQKILLVWYDLTQSAFFFFLHIPRTRMMYNIVCILRIKIYTRITHETKCLVELPQ